MLITDPSEHVYRAKIKLDDDNRVLPSSFTVQGKGISVHLGMNRDNPTICEYLFNNVGSSRGKPVGKVRVPDVLLVPLEILKTNAPSDPHVEITNIGGSKHIELIKSVKLASFCSIVDCSCAAQESIENEYQKPTG